MAALGTLVQQLVRSSEKPKTADASREPSAVVGIFRTAFATASLSCRHTSGIPVMHTKLGFSAWVQLLSAQNVGMASETNSRAHLCPDAQLLGLRSLLHCHQLVVVWALLASSGPHLSQTRNSPLVPMSACHCPPHQGRALHIRMLAAQSLSHDHTSTQRSLCAGKLACESKLPCV